MVLRLRLVAPDWSDAKCIPHKPGANEDPWFGEVHGLPSEGLLEQAAAICNGDMDHRICPQRHHCLIFALTNTEASGVWGGMLPDDLKYMRNHIYVKDWIWLPPIPESLRAAGYLMRARKSRAA